MAAAGRTVFVSSHLLSEVAQTVDRVVIIHEGCVRFTGSLDEVSYLPDGDISLEAAFLRLTAPAATAGAAGSHREQRIT
jgi:ABC-2 type transport system ATP-binding protein